MFICNTKVFQELETNAEMIYVNVDYENLEMLIFSKPETEFI